MCNPLSPFGIMNERKREWLFPVVAFIKKTVGSFQYAAKLIIYIPKLIFPGFVRILSREEFALSAELNKCLGICFHIRFYFWNLGFGICSVKVSSSKEILCIFSLLILPAPVLCAGNDYG